MGNNSVPKFIFSLSRFPVYRGSVLGRFYCIKILVTVSDMLLIFYIVYSGDTVGGEGGAFETNRTLSKQCL